MGYYPFYWPNKILYMVFSLRHKFSQFWVIACSQCYTWIPRYRASNGTGNMSRTENRVEIWSWIAALNFPSNVSISVWWRKDSRIEWTYGLLLGANSNANGCRFLTLVTNCEGKQRNMDKEILEECVIWNMLALSKKSRKWRIYFEGEMLQFNWYSVGFS